MDRTTLTRSLDVLKVKTYRKPSKIMMQEKEQFNLLLKVLKP